MGEKKVTKISLSTFFLIIAIIAICVMGFFIYKLNDDKTNATEQVSELSNRVALLESAKNEPTIIEKTNTNTEIAKNNAESIVDNTKNYLYSDIKGIYNYSDENSSYILTLYENGTFKYLSYVPGATTWIGNYVIVDDKIELNVLFTQGGGIGLSATSLSLTLKINSDGTIEDKSDNENIKLEKKQNNTNVSNELNVNDMIKSQPLENDYKE